MVFLFSARQILLIEVLNIILAVDSLWHSRTPLYTRQWPLASTAGNIYNLLLRKIFKLVAILGWETLSPGGGGIIKPRT